MGWRRNTVMAWTPKFGSLITLLRDLAARPASVSIELDGVCRDVTATELHGSEREVAWKTITSANDRFAKYQDKTDRQLPVIRLTLRRP